LFALPRLDNYSNLIRKYRKSIIPYFSYRGKQKMDIENRKRKVRYDL